MSVQRRGRDSAAGSTHVTRVLALITLKFDNESIYIFTVVLLLWVHHTEP